MNTISSSVSYDLPPTDSLRQLLSAMSDFQNEHGTLWHAWSDLASEYGSLMHGARLGDMCGLCDSDEMLWPFRVRPESRSSSVKATYRCPACQRDHDCWWNLEVLDGWL